MGPQMDRVFATGLRTAPNWRFDSQAIIGSIKKCGFARGVSDLAVLHTLLECGATVRGLRALHAKLYVFGDSDAEMSCPRASGLVGGVLAAPTLPLANPMEDFSGKMFVCSRTKLGVGHHAGEYLIVPLHSRDEQIVQNTIQIPSTGSDTAPTSLLWRARAIALPDLCRSPANQPLPQEEKQRNNHPARDPRLAPVSGSINPDMGGSIRAVSDSAEEHREDRHEFLVGEHPARHPDVEVRAFEVPVGCGVEVGRPGHRDRLDVQHQDAEQRDAAQDIDRVDALGRSYGGGIRMGNWTGHGVSGYG